MDLSAIKSGYEKYITHSYGRFDLCLVEGKGALAWDESGKEYIDFGSGIGVNAFGYSDPAWAKAVADQAAKLSHASNLYYTLPGLKAAELLCENSGMSRVFFGNSGAEANEGIIKTARKRSHDKYGDGRNVIISLLNSFHGRTVTTLAATGQDVMHKDFYPFTEGFRYVPAGDIDALYEAVDESVCGIMIEMVQGEGGVIALEQDYVDKIAALCKEKDIALMVDEVQTGIGRTGSFFAYQQYGIQPNLVSAAKGLGGGLPIGAVLADAEYCEVLGPGTHGSTFGGNPIACAGAVSVLERVADPAFLAEVKEKGEYLREKISAIPQVEKISGLGMMIGLIIKGSKAADVVKKCIAKGAIFLTAKDKVRLLPPLCITKEQIDKGIAVLAEVLAEGEE